MRIAIIAPTPLLHEYGNKGDAYHLTLNHLVISDPTYADYYRRQREAGDFVILDNSSHEHGEGNTVQALRQGIEAIHPNEVVLPDRLFFGGDTVDLSREAMRNLYPDFHNDVNFMGVPQGRTIDEWVHCLQSLINIGVDTIGISKDYEVWPGGLTNLVERVCAGARSMVEIHMLGWGRNLWEIARIAKGYPEVRGVDSAKPLVYAHAKIRLPEDLSPDNCPPYPKRNGFFKLSTVDNELALHNIGIFRRLAGGS